MFSNSGPCGVPYVFLSGESCIDSNQILLDDNDAQLLVCIIGCTFAAKCTIYNCLVYLMHCVVYAINHVLVPLSDSFFCYIKTNVFRLYYGNLRWMYGVKLQDRVPSKELRGRLELEDIISVLQRNRLRWYGHVLRKEDNDWVKKCME